MTLKPPTLPVTSNLQALVRHQGRVHVGSVDGPELLERHDAAPNLDVLVSLDLDGPIAREEMANVAFLKTGCNDFQKVDHGAVLQSDPSGSEVLLGAEVVEKDGEYFLHSQSCTLPPWCNHKALPEVIEAGWLVSGNPNSDRNRFFHQTLVTYR